MDDGHAAAPDGPAPLGPGWRRPVVGVLGGLGPLASAVFQRRTVELTAADRDQDHLDMVVLTHSSTPDRTARILDAGAADPGPVLRADAELLARLGCEVIAVPCNTAQAFLRGEFADGLGVPLLDIVAVAAQEAAQRAGDTGAVGILATSGTLASGIYQDALAVHGARAVLTDEAEQAEVMRVIYEQVKAGLPGDAGAVLDLADALRDRGAGAVVLGCTELSVVYADADLRGHPHLVDGLETLARRTLVLAGAPLRGGA